MKVVKEDKDKRNVTLRLSERVMKKVDKVADTYEVSRQKLIEAILEQAIEDPGLVVKIK